MAPNRFGANVGAVDAVSLIESNYGNLEIVARIGDRLAHFWRDFTGKWSQPTLLCLRCLRDTVRHPGGSTGSYPRATSSL